MIGSGGAVPRDVHGVFRAGGSWRFGPTGGVESSFFPAAVALLRLSAFTTNDEYNRGQAVLEPKVTEDSGLSCSFMGGNGFTSGSGVAASSVAVVFLCLGGVPDIPADSVEGEAEAPGSPLLGGSVCAGSGREHGGLSGGREKSCRERESFSSSCVMCGPLTAILVFTEL